MNFTSLLNSQKDAPVGSPKYLNKCKAYGCPICAPSNSTELVGWTCNIHSKVSPDKWQKVTSRIRANKWLFDLETYIRTKPAWHLIPMEDEHIEHINSVAEAHNCEFLMLTGGKDVVRGKRICAANYEGMYLWPAMQDIVILGKEPSSLGQIPPPEESFPADEDIPF